MYKLKVGDIFETKEGDHINVTVPMHYIYGNRKGFQALATSAVVLNQDEANKYNEGLDISMFLGEYFVIRTEQTGGGAQASMGVGGYEFYPNGHKVWCVRKGDCHEWAKNINFYQDSCNPTIRRGEIVPIGRIDAYTLGATLLTA